MRYSEHLVEQIRDSNNIVEIIGRHTILKPSGHSFMGLCPFPSHKEKSPSFSVSQEKQLYHCFGCGKSGNIYTFLKDYYGYSFVQSLEYLAKRAGIILPEPSGQSKEKTHKRQGLKAIVQLALEHFTDDLKALPQNHDVWAYLKKRGFHKELVDQLKIGWAKDSWTALTDRLQKRGLSLEQAEELGLVKKKTKGSSGYYDGFRGRLMFPVFSFSNEAIGFGGRVLDETKPKYINSPESPVFKKGRIFYGQNWASPHIRQRGEVILVEGYTDWISLFSVGIKNVLATMGTALTEEHSRSIKTWCPKVLCLFDGDEAGKQASQRALKNLFRFGLMVRGVFLDQGEDPDSFVKHRGVKELQSRLTGANDLFLQLLDQKLLGFQGRPDQKVEVLKWACGLLSELPQGSALSSVYADELSSRLSLEKKAISLELLAQIKIKKHKSPGFSNTPPLPRASNNTLNNTLNKTLNNTLNKTPNKKPLEVPLSPLAPKASFDSLAPQTQEASPSSSTDQGASSSFEPKKKVQVRYKTSDPEYILFSLALSHGSLFSKALKEDVSFLDPGTQFLWDLAKDRHGQGLKNTGSLEPYLANFCTNPEALTLTMKRPYSHLSEEQKNEIFHECLHQISKRRMSDESKKMSQKMGPNTNEKDLELFLELQRKRRKLE